MSSLLNADFVTCGYLREHEWSLSIRIPNEIQNEVSKYCQIFDIYSLGDDIENYDDELIACQLNKLYKHNNFKKEHRHSSQSLDIYLISTEITSNKLKFIYTTHHKLYLAKNGKLRQISLSFLRDSKDTIIDIQCGKNHCLFLTKYGDVFCFGSNDAGYALFHFVKHTKSTNKKTKQQSQCGLSKDIIYVSSPTLIPMENEIKITSIACGQFHTLFIDEFQRLLTCGYTYSGQCGISSSETLTIEHLVAMNDMDDVDMMINDSPFDDMESVHSETSESADTASMHFEPMLLDLYVDSVPFIDSDDEDEEDEDESSNLCKYAVYKPTVIEYFLKNEQKIKQIDAGLFHSICVTESGDCFSFGNNYFGQIGNGNYTEFGEGVHCPIKLDIADKIIQIAAGDNHNLLLTAENKILCFGKYKKERIKSPMYVSKKNEFGICENSLIEKLICIQDKSLIVINPYKRTMNE